MPEVTETTAPQPRPRRWRRLRRLPVWVLNAATLLSIVLLFLTLALWVGAQQRNSVWTYFIRTSQKPPTFDAEGRLVTTSAFEGATLRAGTSTRTLWIAGMSTSGNGEGPTGFAQFDQSPHARSNWTVVRDARTFALQLDFWIWALVLGTLPAVRIALAMRPRRARDGLDDAVHPQPN